MRHIFIVNPAAGRRDMTETLRREIEAAVSDETWELCVTQGPGDAGRIVREKAAQYAPETCRFYSCGGDGTLSETAGGAAGVANAQVACVPCGTGNDFIKIFRGTEFFRDIRAQLEGEAVPFDLLRVNDRYSFNIANAGLDARVARWASDNKRKCVFGGGFPYVVSLLIHFFRKINRRYRIELDGQTLDQEIAVAVAANGRYYGGGFYACPEAEPDDGYFNFVAVRRVTRAQLVRCVGKYAVGRHAELGDMQLSCQGRHMILVSDAPEPVCLDGEILFTDRAEITLLPGAVSFSVPKGASLIREAHKAL